MIQDLFPASRLISDIESWKLYPIHICPSAFQKKFIDVHDVTELKYPMHILSP